MVICIAVPCSNDCVVQCLASSRSDHAADILSSNNFTLYGREHWRLSKITYGGGVSSQNFATTSHLQNLLNFTRQEWRLRCLPHYTINPLSHTAHSRARLSTLLPSSTPRPLPTRPPPTRPPPPNRQREMMAGRLDLNPDSFR